MNVKSNMMIGSLSDQTNQETLLWRSRVFQNDGLMKVLKKGKKT